MIKAGTPFIHDGKPAKTWVYFSYVQLWLCKYDDNSSVFYMFEEEIEKAIKENKDKMNFEYKFYEKNLAPKWLEGDYDLHIEGNKMTMTSKDGKKVETRCHPEDDWRLQVGIDELKERMTEAKKPREIKVGDRVKFRYDAIDWYYPHTVSDWCKTNHISIDDVMTAYASNIVFNECDYELKDFRFRVVTVAKHKNQTLAYIMEVNNRYSFIVDTEWLVLAP